MSKFCVVGSGIAGLSAAYYLKKYNPTAEVVVLEERMVSGGVIESDTFSGCVVEWGPRGVRCKGGGKLVLELVGDLGLWDQLVFADDKAKLRYLYHDNKLQVLPHSFSSFLRSPYLGLFVKAFFRDLRAKQNDSDESISEFVDRHFGEGFRRLFFDSMVSGIWAGDVTKMSISATLPFLKDLESRKGSVIKSLFSYKAKAVDAKEYPKEFTSKALFSFENGVQTLVDALKSSLGNSIVYSSKLAHIDFDNSTVKCEDGASYSFDTLVSTIPSHKLSVLVPEAMATELNSINYSPVGVLNILTPKSCLRFDGFGFLVPSKENSVVLGMVANSNTFPSHGSDLFDVHTVMMGGARFSFSDLNEMDLKYEAKVFLDKVFSNSLQIEKQELRLLEYAIPQYEVGHLRRVKRIEDLSPTNLKVLGNFMYGVSVIDIVTKSKEFAKSLI